MSERKLATIAKIDELHPIPDADAIERAVIRGWNVVVKKGEFQVGDKCVYCEIDSLLPEREEFEFLRNKKFRIKTIKLRGQVSQGIAFPMSVLPKGSNTNMGADVTKAMGIIKYEEPIPACLGGKVLGRFPSHSQKTDEERIQNLKESYEEYKQYTWIATEKLDGSSMTAFIHEDQFGVASRNLQLKEDAKNSFWAVARAENLEYKMRLLMASMGFKSLTLQGELIGEGIQKNKYRIKGQTARWFRAFDPMAYKFLPYHDFIYALDEMRLVSVPIVDDDFTLPEKFEDLITYADGRSALYETAREGIVFVAKDAPEKYEGRLSFKVISNKFILKHDQ